MSDTQAIVNGSDDWPSELPLNWGWLLALGLTMLALGGIGVGFAFYLTLAGVLAFAVLALLGGVLQLWHALTANEARWSGRVVHALIALAYLVLGGLLIWDPVSGSISLTLLLAAFLAVLGVSRLVYAWQCRRRGWRWRLALAGGLVDLVLVGIILYAWPAAAFWVIGLFIAVEMIINGWLLTFVALAARQAAR